MAGYQGRFSNLTAIDYLTANNISISTNYSPHYEGDKVMPTGQYVIVANPYTQYPLSDEVDGNFIYRLMQAANTYGFVPKL
jgi:hypothetical protein